MIKNVEKSKVLTLAEEVQYMAGQVVSKTLSQNEHHSLTLFAFDIEEEISTHESGGDAMVFVLDGKANITIDTEEYTLEAGEMIVMPARVSHAVYAKEQFKMLLVVMFD